MGELLRRRDPWLRVDVVGPLLGPVVEAMGLSTLERVVDRPEEAEAAQLARDLITIDQAATPLSTTLAQDRDTWLQRLTEIARSPLPKKFLPKKLADQEPFFPDLPISTQKLFSKPSSASLRHWWFTFSTPRSWLLARYRAHMDAEIAHFQHPYESVGSSAPMSRSELPILWTAVVVEHSDHDGFAVLHRKDEALRRILAARLAVRAYTLRQGRPPASLSALVPNYLPSVPQDPFAPASLVCRVVHGKPLVYSRGPDGDDDGGRTPAVRLKPGDDGDLVGIARRRITLPPRQR
jgi:hypothetical protein